mmetsp:Transcript_4867/g.15006  ORF Transcript_4867/g.15006 Transcript_4867/m.15006 type:complete len:247 (-) Transcript_4867:84-824(-)
MPVDLSPPQPGAASPPQPGGGGFGGMAAGFRGQVAQAAVQDPWIQRQLQEAAYDHAQQGIQVARVSAAHAVQEFRNYVQEGPAGVSILCFLGGIATTLVGIMGLLNIFSTLTSPFHYVLNAYLTGFGVVTVLLEADVESVKNMRIVGKLGPVIERYQGEVFNRANFLTELKGRGLYYIFVGNLAITQCLFCLLFLIGAWNIIMGALCLMMSFGINPADHLELPQGSPHAQHPQAELLPAGAAGRLA